jgi:hypothetical protein
LLIVIGGVPIYPLPTAPPQNSIANKFSSETENKMPDGHKPNLPVAYTAPVQPQPFPVNALVYLKSLRVGPPGRVVGFKRGRAIVHFDAPLNFTGKFRADALILAQAPDEDEETDEDESEEES